MAAMKVGLVRRRLGTSPAAVIRKLAEGGLGRGLECGIKSDMGARQFCGRGEPVKHPHPPKDPVYRAQKPLELVHIDTSGPLSTGAWDGSKYSVVIVDDYSHKSWILLVREKTDIPQRVKEHSATFRNGE